MEQNTQDIHYKQCFQNYSRTYKLLRSAIVNRSVDDFSDLELEGVMHRFEYTFELGWKTFMEYLDYCGITLKEATPRRVIKECATSGIFNNAGIISETYIDMMITRNAMSHMYDFDRFKEALKKIKDLYINELEKEYMFFMRKESNEND